MISRIASRIRSLFDGDRSKQSPAGPTTTQEILGDFLGAVGDVAPGYRGDGRASIVPPIAPRDSSIDLAKIESAPSTSMRDADTDVGQHETDTEKRPTPGNGRREPGGWGDLDFGGSR